MIPERTSAIANWKLTFGPVAPDINNAPIWDQEPFQTGVADHKTVRVPSIADARRKQLYNSDSLGKDIYSNPELSGPFYGMFRHPGSQTYPSRIPTYYPRCVYCLEGTAPIGDISGPNPPWLNVGQLSLEIASRYAPLQNVNSEVMVGGFSANTKSSVDDPYASIVPRMGSSPLGVAFNEYLIVPTEPEDGGDLFLAICNLPYLRISLFDNENWTTVATASIPEVSLTAKVQVILPIANYHASLLQSQSEKYRKFRCKFYLWEYPLYAVLGGFAPAPFSISTSQAVGFINPNGYSVQAFTPGDYAGMAAAIVSDAVAFFS